MKYIDEKVSELDTERKALQEEIIMANVTDTEGRLKKITNHVSHGTFNITFLLQSSRFGEALRIVQDRLNEKNFYAFNPGFDCNPMKEPR